MKTSVWVASVGFAALLVHAGSVRAQEQCAGDCDDSNDVVISEIITCVNIAQGLAEASTCPACDVNGDDAVTINELIAAVNAALCGCPGCPTPTPTATGGTVPATPTSTPTIVAICGDGVTDEAAGETCDDGNNFGGDDCAANCTAEDARLGVFDPTKASATVQTEAIPIVISLSGSMKFRTGQIRDTDVFGPGGVLLFKAGEMPVAGRASELLFDPVPVTGLVCACVRGVPVDSLFGPGNWAAGSFACGEQGLTDINYRLVQDHNVVPGDRNNRIQGTPDDPECDDVSVLPGGTTSKSCLEGTGELCNKPENEHVGLCNGPRVISRSGGVSPDRGSAFILDNTAIGLLRDAGACDKSGRLPCAYPEYGPDCQPCTDDDVEKGDPENIPLTTGMAEAVVYDANNNSSDPNGNQPIIIEDGRSCFGIPCVTTQTGDPFDCDELVQNPTGGLTDAAIVVVFPSLDAKQIGDNVTGAAFVFGD